MWATQCRSSDARNGRLKPRLPSDMPPSLVAASASCNRRLAPATLAARQPSCTRRMVLSTSSAWPLWLARSSRLVASTKNTDAATPSSALARAAAAAPFSLTVLPIRTARRTCQMRSCMRRRVSLSTVSSHSFLSADVTASIQPCGCVHSCRRCESSDTVRLAPSSTEMPSKAAAGPVRGPPPPKNCPGRNPQTRRRRSFGSLQG